MAEKFQIRKVNVDNAPGFSFGEYPELEELSPEINIIHGPNGSGKTTLSKILQAAVWQENGRENYEAQVSANWKSSSFELSTTREKQDLPGLVRDSGLYRLSIVEFLQNSENARRFSLQIRRELSFGINLEKAAEEAGNKARVRKSQETRSLQSAIDSLEELYSIQKQNSDLKQKLDGIRNQVAQAQALKEQLEEVQAGIELLKGLEVLEDLKQMLDKYDKALKNLSSDSLSVFSQLRDDLRKSRQTEDELKQSEARQTNELSRFSLPETLTSSRESTGMIEQRIRKLQDLQRSLETLETGRAENKARLDWWSGQYSWLVNTPDMENLRDKVGVLESLASESEAVRSRLEVARERYDQTRNQTDEEPSKKQVRKKTGKPSWLIIVLSAVSFSLGICSIALGNLPLCIPALLGLLAAAVLGLLPDKSAKLQLNQARHDLEQAEGKYHDWLQKHQAAADALGIKEDSPFPGGQQFFNFSRILLDWQSDIGKSKEIQAVIDETSHQYQEQDRQLRSLAVFWDDAALMQADELGKRLTGQLREYWRAEDALSQTRVLLAQASEKTEELEGRMDAFWKKTGIQDRSEDTLTALCQQVPDYQQLKSAVRLQEVQFCFSDIPEESLEVLQEKQQELENKLTEIENRREELGSLTATYESLINSGSVAVAKQKVEEEEKAFGEIWEESALATAVNFLTGELEKSVQLENQPELLKKASRYMESFSCSRHDICYDRQGFYVHDAQRGSKIYRVEELSSGTKVQFLLALRLGAIELEEKGVPYPVFFDEALANSDDMRSQALTEAIVSLAETRQVFFFTAQEDEVQRIQKSAGKLAKTICLKARNV